MNQEEVEPISRSMDLRAVAAKHNVVVYIGSDVATVKHILENQYGPEAMTKNCRILMVDPKDPEFKGFHSLSGYVQQLACCHPGVACDPEYDGNELVLQYLDDMRTVTTEFMTWQSWAVMYGTNHCWHVQHSNFVRDASCWKAAVKASNAIVFGAGPSLDMTLAEIEEQGLWDIVNRCLILATDAAVPALSKTLLRPNIIASLDCVDNKTQCVTGYFPDALLVGTVQSHPDPFADPKRKHSVVALDGGLSDNMSQVVKRLNKLAWTSEGWVYRNVGHFLWFFARFCGIENILFSGIDCVMHDDKHHSDGVDHESPLDVLKGDVNAKKTWEKLKDVSPDIAAHSDIRCIDGRMRKTIPVWRDDIVMWQRLLATKGHNTMTASPIAADLGLPFISVADYLTKNEPTKRVNFDKLPLVKASPMTLTAILNAARDLKSFSKSIFDVQHKCGSNPLANIARGAAIDYVWNRWMMGLEELRMSVRLDVGSDERRIAALDELGNILNDGLEMLIDGMKGE